jgi:hypothetical protein
MTGCKSNKYLVRGNQNSDRMFCSLSDQNAFISGWESARGYGRSEGVIPDRR